MTLVVLILAICLVLALAAGVVESCIASWMIRRYKNVRSKDSSAQNTIESLESRLSRATSNLEEVKQQNRETFESLVQNVLMPTRSAIIKTCKTSAKTAEKTKAKNIMKALSSLQSKVIDDKTGEWLGTLIVDIESIVDAEL